jgi:hypothetical protein
MKDELAEVHRVAKRLEDRPVEIAGEIDLAPRTVAEPQPHDKVPNVPGFQQPGHALLQWRYGPQKLLRPSAFPIVLQFGQVRLPPFLHVPERTTRQTTPEDKTVSNAHRCLVLAVRGVEMRWVVIVEEHTDHDAQEPADLRHADTLRRSSAMVGPA